MLPTAPLPMVDLKLADLKLDSHSFCICRTLPISVAGRYPSRQFFTLTALPSSAGLPCRSLSPCHTAWLSRNNAR